MYLTFKHFTQQMSEILHSASLAAHTALKTTALMSKCGIEFGSF